jgi:hypothetical protein
VYLQCFRTGFQKSLQTMGAPGLRITPGTDLLDYGIRLPLLFQPAALLSHLVQESA